MSFKSPSLLPYFLPRQTGAFVGELLMNWPVAETETAVLPRGFGE